MNQFRLSTLLLLVIIAVLCVALAVVQDRAFRRVNALRAQLNQQTPGAFKTWSTRPPVPSSPTVK